MSESKHREKSQTQQRLVVARAPLLQRVADVGMLLLIFPLLVVGWSMALSLPAVIAGAAVGLGDDVLGELLVVCVIVSVLPSVAVSSRRLTWWLRVEDDQLVMGPLWPRIRVPLREIEMLRVGSLGQRLRGEEAPLHVPLVIIGRSRHQIQLRPNDADQSLHQLLRMSPNAVGISRTDKETLPSNPEARKTGMGHLRRFWLLSGGFALVLCVGIGLAMIVAVLRDGTFDGPGKVINFLYLSSVIWPAAGYAAFALHRVRRR